MDDGFYQWLNSESAAPHLQRMGLDQKMMGQYGNPMGGYQSELLRWMELNPENPDLQNQIASQYLDSIDPSYTQQMDYQRRLDDLNMAIALKELGDNELASEIFGGYGYGVNQQAPVKSGPDLSMYGYYGNTPSGVSSGIPSDLSGYQTQSLQNKYGPMLESTTDPEKFQLYSLLASGNPEVASLYNQKQGLFERPKNLAWWQYLFPALALLPRETKTKEERVANAYGI